MGRSQFLTRLALGRSALLSPCQLNQSHDEGLSTAHVTSGHEPSVQRNHDSRRRSLDPSFEARNLAMRNAKNKILTLVGIVEDNVTHSQETEDRDLYRIDAMGTALLAAEDMLGHDLDWIWTTLRPYLSWWTGAVLRSQCLAGLFPPSTPAMAIIKTHWSPRRLNRVRWVVHAFLPGAFAFLTYTFAKVLLDTLLEHCIGTMQQRVIRRNDLSRETAKRICAGIDGLHSGLSFATEIALLPLSCYASAQALHTLPAFPLLPSALELTHGLANPQLWQTCIDAPLLRHLATPAALKLMLVALQDHPRVRYSSSEWIMATEVHSSMRSVESLFAWFNDRIQRARTRLMRMLGWSLDDLVFKNNDRAKYPNSNLTLLPRRWLATTIDLRLQDLLLIPPNVIAYRSIANAFNHTGHTSTPYLSGHANNHRQVPELTAIAFAQSSAPRWSRLGGHVGQVGLCTGLQLCVDAITFKLVYTSCMWTGRYCCGWTSIG